MNPKGKKGKPMSATEFCLGKKVGPTFLRTPLHKSTPMIVEEKQRDHSGSQINSLEKDKKTAKLNKSCSDHSESFITRDTDMSTLHDLGEMTAAEFVGQTGRSVQGGGSETLYELLPQYHPTPVQLIKPYRLPPSAEDIALSEQSEEDDPEDTVIQNLQLTPNTLTWFKQLLSRQ